MNQATKLAQLALADRNTTAEMIHTKEVEFKEMLGRSTYFLCKKIVDLQSVVDTQRVTYTKELKMYRLATVTGDDGSKIPNTITV